MFTLCSIASGSSGNCVYIGTETTKILVDVGLSAKRIEEGLAAIGVSPNEINAILITHEHTDHVQGLSVLQKKYKLPIYTTGLTLDAYFEKAKNGSEMRERFREVVYDDCFWIGDIKVTPFEISHDAVRPVSYTFEADNKKIAMATDLGYYTEKIVDKLQCADILYLEANHDYNMLMVGPYSYSLKTRVAGDRGHLSNDTVAELICKLLHCDLKAVVLAHLSKENNFPELAYETVRVEMQAKWKYEEPFPLLMVAPREKPLDKIII